MSVRKGGTAGNYIVIGFIFLVVAVGLTYLFKFPKELSRGAPPEVAGIISSSSKTFRGDRSIFTYEAKVKGRREYTAKRQFHARENACGIYQRPNGEKVVLIVQEVDGAKHVLRAETVDGCVLYDDNLLRYMKSLDDVSVMLLLVLMYGASFGSFAYAMVLVLGFCVPGR